MAKVRAAGSAQGRTARKAAAGAPATPPPKEANPPKTTSEAPARPREILNFPTWVWMTALVVVPLAVFLQVLGFPFTTWDDTMMVTQNPWLDPVRRATFTHFWHYPYYDFFAPLLYHYYALMVLISHALHPGPGVGLSPAIFHAANLLLHLGNVWLVFFFLRRLRFPDYAASLGALLFSVHPLVAEPVSWIASVDTLLTTLFCLLALHQYLYYAGIDGNGQRRWLHFALASIFFFLAVIAKPTALCLPVMVLVIEILQLHRPVKT
ncbi:MAG TPA: hypothetical protein VFW40_01005, partial [Capsulimonadaceae bacterium]|nr:hypothetical protein [Capsulimonadaceae bacterium]